MKNPLLFAAFAACCLWLAACNESPTSAFGDLIDDQARDDAYWEAKNDCTNKGGTWDSWYNECSYRSSSSYYYYSSSSSYSTTSYYYTTTQKTMRITTTSYRQTTYDWDVFDNAGDPEISYKVVFTKKDGTTSTSYTSSHFLGTDTRSYASEFHDDVTVPVNTSYFYIYPKVVDRDVSYNDDKSSGYGFGWENVGYTKTGQLHSETDNKGGYSLSFNWQFL